MNLPSLAQLAPHGTSLMALTIAAPWIAMGSAVLAYPGTTPRQPLVHRIAAGVLLAFSGSMFVSLPASAR